jgi:DNA-binding NarL/FixJ family response regulator
VRVALADDSALFREGLRLLLETAAIDVVAQARTGAELVAAVAEDPPDAVVLDVRMPPSFTDEGLVTAESLRAAHPGIAILVLSAYVETSFAVRLLRNGSAGLGMLSKDRVADLPTLIDALTRITSGETVIDQDVVTRLLTQPSRTRDLDRLSEREQDVLRLMAEGRSNSGIALALHLSERTVETYTANIFDKFALAADRVDNRRVLAVLTWLRESSAPS